MIKASIEICKNIGCFGLNNRNEKGIEVLDMLRMHDLYAPFAFFNHKNCVTWRSFNKEKDRFN